MSRFCAALFCNHEPATNETPFCLKHWGKLSFKAQRRIRNREAGGVKLAVDELYDKTIGMMQEKKPSVPRP